MMFISGEERDQRTQPYRDKQSDFSKKPFTGTENVVGFAIQIIGCSYNVIFVM